MHDQSHRPPRRQPLLARLILSVWIGSGTFLIAFAAPAVFEAAPSINSAANIVGAMLTRWHYLALVAPLLLLVIEWRRARGCVIVILFVAILLAASEAVIDLAVRVMRQQSSVSISMLDPDDPVRRRFGMLHGLSSLLLLGQVVAAAAWLVAVEERDEPQIPSLPMANPLPPPAPSVLPVATGSADTAAPRASADQTSEPDAG